MRTEGKVGRERRMTGEVFFGKSIIKKAGQWSRLILLQEASSEVRKSKTLSDQTGLFEGRVEGCRQRKSFECLKDRLTDGEKDMQVKRIRKKFR